MNLCLVAIVKNEEKTLGRMLDSCEGLFDSYQFVDTGSTDGTVEYLKYELGTDSVVERRWVNFGHNLTEAFEYAQWNWRPDWLLRLDADQTITYLPNFREWLEEQTEEDGFNVAMQENGVLWRLPRLLKGGQRWEFKGATHEYLDTEGRAFRDLNGFQINHYADGSNRGTKFERDIQLLEEGVRQNDPRSIFYTAESFRYLSQWWPAYLLYWRRAKMKGTWEEERWYAQYRAGECMLQIDPQQGIEELVDAWKARPWRSEPLMRIREFCDLNRIQNLSTDSLFVEARAYV